MGKASRWLKGLLGSKKEKEQAELSPVTASDDRKEKRRRSFTKPGRNSGDQELSLRRSYIAESEDEQSKHAIAVAAATAAAADAAVAAAHAAVAVVRFTSNNRATPTIKRSAALRIQCVFRGYLARKALRALRALVKLQALVRGFLVRKRTSAALSSMEALLRAQMIVQLQRSRRSFDKENRFQPRRSYEKRSDDSRAEFQSKRHSTSYETAYNLSSETPRLRSRRINNADNLPVTPPLTHHVPAGIAVTDKAFLGLEWSFVGDEIKFSTAHNTPRLQKPVGGGQSTPARSVSGEGYLRDYSNFPNYMSNTQSFMAKLRSNSAPKQRPETGPRKVSLYEVMAARKSLSGVGMQRPATENLVDRFRGFSGET